MPVGNYKPGGKGPVSGGVIVDPSPNNPATSGGSAPPSLAVPSLASILPGGADANTAVVVSLAGTGLSVSYAGDVAVVLVSGSGITAGAATVVSDREILVTLTIAAAQVGARSITVQTDGGVSNAVQFQVNGTDTGSQVGGYPNRRRHPKS